MMSMTHHYISFTYAPQLGLFQFITWKHDDRSNHYGKNTCSLLKTQVAPHNTKISIEYIVIMINTMVW